MIETLLELLGREAAMLIVLAALGSFPAALLPGEFPAGTRVIAAPAFGLALGLGLMLSASQFLTMSTAAWAILLPAALASLGGAFLAGRRFQRPPSAGPVAIAAAVVLVCLIALDAPFAGQHTLGPAGYTVADASGYATESQALADHTWNEEEFGPVLDAKATRGSRGIHGVLHAPAFQAGTAPLASSLGELFGWRAIDVQAAFMAVLIAVGAAAAFAFVLAATGSAPGAAVAALLFAGPVTYQLYIDASQAALAGLPLFAPAALAGLQLLRAPLRAGALLGVCCAGIATAYPAWLPLVAGALILGAAILLYRDRRHRRALARRLAGAGAVTLLLLLLVSPVALAADLRYARDVSRGILDRNYGEATVGEPLHTLSFGKPVSSPAEKDQLPEWDLPAGSVPAWLSGSRDLYFLPGPGEAGLGRWVAFDVLFPLLALVLALAGCIRFPRARPLLLLAAASLLGALYSYTVRDCSYCGERNLLPLAVVLALLAGAGLAAAGPWLSTRWGVRAARLIVAAIGLLLVIVPLQRDTVLARRLNGGGFFVGEDALHVIDRAAKLRRPVAVEGLGTGVPQAAGIQSALLLGGLLAQVQKPPVIDVHSLPSAGYFSDDPPRDRDIDPGYRWVFTTMSGVRGPRETVTRSGPYALQRRTGPLDVTIDSGVMQYLPQHDSSGDAWVQGPLTFTLAGPASLPAHLLIGLRGPAAQAVRVQGHAQVLTRNDQGLRACVPVPGKGPIRRTTLPLKLPPAAPAGPPDSWGNVAPPVETLRIASLRAVPGGCPATNAALGSAG